MPFIYDFEQIEWPEDRGDDYWPEPTPEEYEYLKPEEFGGEASPVRFEVPLQLQRKPTEKQGVPHRRGLFGRLFRAVAGRTKIGRIAVGFSDTISSMSVHSVEQRLRQQNLFCLMIPAFIRIGGVELTCAYDGGNDEGFAWFRSLKTADRVLDKAQLVSQLEATDLVASLRGAGLLYESIDYPRTDAQHIEEVLESLAEEWGVLMLGSGFGTGAFQMFGAFTVDLIQHTITDDLQATAPADGNIRFPDRSDYRDHNRSEDT